MLGMKEKAKLSPPEDWLENYGDLLYRYAYFRVNDQNTAEDLVQETLLAALKSRQNFAGRSSESTWLVGILKNKILDYLRKYLREQTLEAGDAAEQEDDLSAYFAANGHWKTLPTVWENPDESLEQTEFWTVFEQCVAGIPPKQAQVFRLCEIEGMSGKEVGKELGMTSTNIWVALHRARLKLRDCLERTWFKANKA